MRPADFTNRRDSLLRSVYLAAGELLETPEDPLALACYLWVLRRHRLTLANSDALLAWAHSWIQDVLVEGRAGSRRDEALTSAALAAAALVDTSGLTSPARDTIRRRLADELHRGGLPFGHPGYAAVLLFAARRLGVREVEPVDGVRAVGDAFLGALPDGDLFGLGFVVRLLSETGTQAQLETVGQRAQEAAQNPHLDPDQRAYLAQALWYLGEAVALSPGIEALIREVIEYPPLRAAPALRPENSISGEPRAPGPYSHIAHAAQLDVFLAYYEDAQQREEARKDRTYRGSGLVTASAFGFYILVIAGFWVAVTWLTLPWADDAWRYWVRHDYNGVRSATALLLLIVACLLSYSAAITPVILWTVSSVLLWKRVESDRRMLELLLRRLRKISIWWLLGVVVVIVLGIITNIITPGFEHITGGDR